MGDCWRRFGPPTPLLPGASRASPARGLTSCLPQELAFSGEDVCTRAHGGDVRVWPRRHKWPCPASRVTDLDPLPLGVQTSPSLSGVAVWIKSAVFLKISLENLGRKGRDKHSSSAPAPASGAPMPACHLPAAPAGPELFTNSVHKPTQTPFPQGPHHHEANPGEDIVDVNSKQL